MDAQWVKHEKYVLCPFTLNAITWLNALGQWCEHSMSHLYQRYFMQMTV